MKIGKFESVFGIYKTPSDVDVAVSTLKAQGFLSSDISVLMPQKSSRHGFAHHRETKAPEGTSVGATTGAILGGGLGWLVGIGALAIPGVGPFIAAGPLMALLAGVGVGGTIGGVAGALVGLGIPEYEAKRYEGLVRDGGILLSVHCENANYAREAETLLEQTGAEDISIAGEVTDYSYRKPPVATEHYDKNFDQQI